MYRVLIADDEPIERMVITKKLNKIFSDRIEVIAAENGTDALNFYQEKECRIAILDINMPGMTGLEVARALRKQSRDHILIFLTAYDEFDYARQAIAVRALDYLLKPGSDEELTTAVEEALRLAAEQDERRRMDAEMRNSGLPGIDEEKTEGFGGTGLESEDQTRDNARMRLIAGEILDYINKNYQEDIALQDIAGALGYSEAYFCKIFRQCFSKSFTSYLTEYRIQMAKKLLADVRNNIKDISMQVGVRDSNYFARIFKRYVGKTPSEYRNSLFETGS